MMPSFQTDLNGFPTLNKQEVKDYCCVQCYTAKDDKCVCHCNGEFHGKGKHPTYETNDTQLAPDQAAPFLEEIKDLRCHWCNASLKNQPIYAYKHSGGWKVKGLDALMWLYIVCPNCLYQWALWKLGVKR